LPKIASARGYGVVTFATAWETLSLGAPGHGKQQVISKLKILV